MGRKRQPIALRKQMTDAAYDDDGFVTSSQYHLSEQQLEWLLCRMSVLTDEDACRESMIDLPVVEEWRLDPGFVKVCDESLANKRNAARYLSSQLIPKAIRTISTLMDSDKIAGQVQGVNLLLRMQGLLMDKKSTADKDAINQLVAALKAPQRAPNVIDVTPRLLDGPNSTAETDASRDN